ncbi:alpha-ribazole phosphatase [Burkholderia sp. WAC0059]|uniref:alpha-ribazole phosphatase family protein n=1 Tax=Burkholderia sp. WAC0059 TaxID=2066022 RepID=UPI000C7ED22D|nr:alpha-ribazole phosphatase family protein [Burkholderia sp. WAC0059]PLZ00501.1 alpha-ribazole phosphatase [Burkholderia sp. WAC0059]
MDLVLIRHPAVAVPAGVCYGRSEVPLAVDPRDAAATLAARLEALGVSAAGLPRRIETSPRQRCARVAAALAERIALSEGEGEAAREDARLAEMDFGAWEMRPWDAIGRAPLYAWAADFYHAREHGGESVAQFGARVQTWFDGLQRDPQPPMRWVVTHAGVIRAVTAQALGVPLERCARWPVDFAGIVWLRREPERAQGDAWTLVRWNA